MSADKANDSPILSALAACRSKLTAFIRGRTAVRDDADDILQEVTYQLMKVEQPVENVAAWLFRAARNEMTDRARKKRELPLSVLYSDDEEDDYPEDELAETLFGVPQTPEDLSRTLTPAGWPGPSQAEIAAFLQAHSGATARTMQAIAPLLTSR